MSIFKDKSKGFYLALTAACLAIVGLIAYLIGIADAGSTANELIPYVVAPICVAVLIEAACAFLPKLAGLRAIVPAAYCLAFAAIAYSVVFYIVNVSAKMHAYLSPAKVVGLIAVGAAMLLGCVSAFMKDTK